MMSIAIEAGMYWPSSRTRIKLRRFCPIDGLRSAVVFKPDYKEFSAIRGRSRAQICHLATIIARRPKFQLLAEGEGFRVPRGLAVSNVNDCWQIGQLTAPLHSQARRQDAGPRGPGRTIRSPRHDR